MERVLQTCDFDRVLVQGHAIRQVYFLFERRKNGFIERHRDSDRDRDRGRVIELLLLGD